MFGLLNHNIYHTVGAYRMPGASTGNVGLRFVLASHAGYGNMYAMYARTNGLSALLTLLQGRGEALVVRDYVGAVPGGLLGIIGGLPLADGLVLNSPALRKEGGTLRSFGRVAAYLKDYCPTAGVDPVPLCAGVVYDAPYLYVGGRVVCKFCPVLGVLSGDTCRVESGVFAYEVRKPGYVLDEGSRRHTAVNLLECLYVNQQTGKVTCSYSDVLNGKMFYSIKAEFDESAMSWKALSSSKRAVLGFKQA